MQLFIDPCSRCAPSLQGLNWQSSQAFKMREQIPVLWSLLPFAAPLVRSWQLWAASQERTAEGWKTAITSEFFTPALWQWYFPAYADLHSKDCTTMRTVQKMVTKRRLSLREIEEQTKCFLILKARKHWWFNWLKTVYLELLFNEVESTKWQLKQVS